MSFFLSSTGFRPYVDHRWSTGGSKDITGHPISQQRGFLLVFFFTYLTNTRTNTPPITSKCHRRSARLRGSAGTAPPPTEEGSSSPLRTGRAENPRRYEILAGSAPAATAQTTYVMCPEQHNIIRAASEARVAVVPRPVVDRGNASTSCVLGCVQDV